MGRVGVCYVLRQKVRLGLWLLWLGWLAGSMFPLVGVFLINAFSAVQVPPAYNVLGTKLVHTK